MSRQPFYYADGHNVWATEMKVLGSVQRARSELNASRAVTAANAALTEVTLPFYKQFSTTSILAICSATVIQSVAFTMCKAGVWCDLPEYKDNSNVPIFTNQQVRFRDEGTRNRKITWATVITLNRFTVGTVALSPVITNEDYVTGTITIVGNLPIDIMAYEVKV